jgi:hypothetical protein
MPQGIKEQEWYHDPFGWYVKHDRPEMMGVKLTNKVALDFLQGLYDVWKRLEANNLNGAKKDLSVLATLVIASCTGFGEEAVEELLVDELYSKNMDEEINKLLEGE